MASWSNFLDQFDALCAEAHRCEKCSRMRESARVLSRAAGALTVKLMFIGEAPGRLGADHTCIPFHGDKAGHNFESLLSHVGISRDEIFVTNSVLCNPRETDGNNATPSQQELANCNEYLRRQIDLIDPKIVVTLGAVALRAIALIEDHDIELSKHVRTAQSWYGRKLIPTYHPGQRAMVHRSFANQLSDYQFIAEQLHRLDKKRSIGLRPISKDVFNLVDQITRRRQRLSYFALHKLVYLIEYRSVTQTGRRLTRAYFVREKDGP